MSSENYKKDSDESDDGESECTSPAAAAVATGSRGSNSFSVESIRQFIAEKFHLFSEESESETDSSARLIENLNFNGLINHWKEKGFKKIITMVGAGISTSAGIPDFRSPVSGLYHNLTKYNLPHPTAIFEMSYLRENPKPFFVLARELYPGSFKPTPCHYFVRLLNEKGLLLRHYTQNIDTLERIAEIPDDKLVEAHGTFFTNHCLECDKLYSMEWMKQQIFDDLIPECDCNGIVKPDIVFFGENLPERFYELPGKDFKECDLLIIMGTSLEVQPFAGLVDRAGSKCLRLLINREKVGRKNNSFTSWMNIGGELKYDQPDNKRDIAWIGDCDDGVFAIADAMGWGEELRSMILQEHAKIDAAQQADDVKEPSGPSTPINSSAKF